MQKVKLGFIGAGNMASSIIGGLIANDFDANNIWISDKNAQSCERLESLYSVNSLDNASLVQQVDIVVLAVKPQVMKLVCEEISQYDMRINKKLFVSIAAGINTQSLENWLTNAIDETTSIIRCMPNTPALIQCSASGLYANKNVNETQKTQTEYIMNAIGSYVWVKDETLINSITAVSGSGPAYFFLLMEAMINSAMEQGLDNETAENLVKQTALGAARMFSEGELSASQLRINVTSPGGTTEKALDTFNSANFSGLVNKAISNANNRAEELSTLLGK